MNYVKEFEKDCMIRGLTKQTITTYKSNISDFLAATQNNPARITQGDLRDHLITLQARRYAASTYNSYYASLNTFYEFLIYEGITVDNPIPAFRQRYLSHIMKTAQGETRQLISVDDMRRLIRQTKEIRIIAMLATFAKTGIRRGEFLDLKPANVDLDKNIINLAHKPKRSRQTVFMDHELHDILKMYLAWRERNSYTKWLWVTERGGRMTKDHPGDVIRAVAQPCGLHRPDGALCERLTPHCFRHFFTTHLYRAGMDPQYIKWLRGDSLRKEAWQIYNHIDPETVRAEYEQCIPKLL